HGCDVGGVVTHDEGAEPANRIGDDEASVGGEVARFTPAMDAFVREHANEGPDVLGLVVVRGGALGRVHHVDLDVGDLHDPGQWRLRSVSAMVRWAARSASSALPNTTTATPLGTRRSVTTPA